MLVVLAALSLRPPRPSKACGKKIVAGVASVRAEDLGILAELAAAGAVLPLIDRSYPLEDAAHAHSYVDKGHKRGNVVQTVAHSAVPQLAA